MGERPGGVTALMWALIVMGLLGVFGNSLAAASSAASNSMLELSSASQEAALEGLEGAEADAMRSLVDGQSAMMDAMIDANRRTRPWTLALGVLGMLVSGVLVYAGFRGLKGGQGGHVLRRVLWAAGAWSVLKFAGNAWVQQVQTAAMGDQLEQTMAAIADASGTGGELPDFSGIQEGMAAVTLAFGALVVVGKLLLYGYGLWVARQPEAKAWLVDGIGVDPAGPAVIGE